MSEFAVVQTEDTGTGEPIRYYIDQSWYDTNGISFRTAAQGRFCPECQKRVGSVAEESVPVVDQKAGRVVYETRQVSYGDNPIAVIRAHCSKERNYITPDTPVVESVFRMFLASGNQPATLDHVRDSLSDWVSYRDRPHGYAPDLVKRLLEADRRYGIRPFPLGD